MSPAPSCRECGLLMALVASFSPELPGALSHRLRAPTYQETGVPWFFVSP